MEIEQKDGQEKEEDKESDEMEGSIRVYEQSNNEVIVIFYWVNL